MSASLEYLEGLARKYAIEAVKYDRANDYDNAIKCYRNAINVLKKIIELYPDLGLRKVYEEWIKEYSRRIKHLEMLKNRKLVPVGGDGSYEESEESIEDFILKKKPNVSFKDVADLEHAKEAIKEAIIYPIKRPDLFPLGWPRGILLFGPPGCGKTYLAAAVANEVDGIFMYVDAANVMSKWLGDAEKNVAKIFKVARKHAENSTPVIIFIDEIDSLLGVFSTEVGGEVRVRNQFLKEMDGLQDKDSKYHIYVIGATNKPWRLDEAFIRRFQKRIYIPLPDKRARLELLKLYTKGLRLASDVDLNELAEKLDGYSASDIKDIIMAAHMRTVKELFEKYGGVGDPRPITMEDFEEIIKIRKPSVKREAVKIYEAWYERFKAL